MSLLWYPSPDLASVVTEDWAAQELRGPSGAISQARVLRPAPMRRVELSWVALDASSALSLRRQMRGANPSQKIHFYSPHFAPEIISVGKGNGTQQYWRVGLTDEMRQLMSPKCFVNSSEISSSDFGLGWENLLPSSENLGDTARWTAFGGATVTRTGGQTAPDGSATAWRIQTSGGTDTGKLDNIGYGNTYLPANWRIYMRLWVRNLSIGRSVVVWFRGFQVLATISPQTPWTLISGTCVQTVAFPPGIRFSAVSASDSLDFVIWQPMIIAFMPDGRMVSSKEWGDSLGYLPTPTGQYIAGDLNLRRWTIGFRNAPANNAPIELHAYGRRLLWGRMRSEISVQSHYPGRIAMAAQLEGEEATGDET